MPYLAKNIQQKKETATITLFHRMAYICFLHPIKHIINVFDI